MPRLSLWKDGTHSNDYKFFDRRISEMFTVGGTGILIHKYLGVEGELLADATPTKPAYDAVSELNIQDLLFLENRDRKYDTSVYVGRGIYQVQDNSFDLSQFGLFIQTGTLFMVFHINDMVQLLGRKLINGDVLELQHLMDYNSLDESVPVALKRFFVVSDAQFASEGFSPTWWPHLWRVKLNPMTASQEYKDILAGISSDPLDPNAAPIGDYLSTLNKYLNINDAVITQAELDVPKSGYDTSILYTKAVMPDGRPADPPGTNTVDGNGLTADNVTNTSDQQAITSTAKVGGYMSGDGLAPNGATVGNGIVFPTTANVGDYFLRLDYLPNRLFRYDGTRWNKVEDVARTSLTPGASNQTQLGSFINNNKTWTDASGKTRTERTSLSKALKPKADNIVTSVAPPVATPISILGSVGANAHIGSIRITGMNTNNLSLFECTIRPRTGTLSAPIKITWTKNSLINRGLINNSAIQLPIYGLYGRHTNVIDVRAVFVDSSTVDLNPVIIVTPEGPVTPWSNLTKIKQRNNTQTLGYNFIMHRPLWLVNQDNISPMVLDTDGYVRWVADFTALESITSTWCCWDNIQNEFIVGGHPTVTRLNLNGGYKSVPDADFLSKNIKDFHHDLVKGKTGYLGAINSPAIQMTTLTKLAGVAEFDGETGEVIKIWNLETILNDHMVANGDTNTQMFDDLDWCHINSAAYDPYDDSIIVSSRENFVIKIDYSTDEIIWIFGKPNKYWYTIPSLRDKALTIVGEGKYPLGQHCMSIPEAGKLLMFNNGIAASVQPYLTGSDETESVVSYYSINTENKTATVIWEYYHPEHLLTPVTCSAVLANDQSALIMYSYQTQRLVGLDANKQIAFDYQYHDPTNSGSTALPIAFENLIFNQ